ncbi:DUF1566 domain-containing protein [Thalassotalea psychrophila]|uniref:DUF1566 domain-containing protein n=1 Tax=Thalassotalea psychrophila TaxID=3065647 RepID=A0ABY9U018_9GAMM|nr:DUF1566 domain-containing protein [Colwelliaceae bacterium SQ149]
MKKIKIGKNSLLMIALFSSLGVSAADQDRGTAPISQECSPFIPHTTPSFRYSYSDTGATATDKITGLTWSRCTYGQAWDAQAQVCEGNATLVTWSAAFTAASTQDLDNLTHWRVPNIKELNTIIEGGCTFPAINSEVFPNTVASSQQPYWSSTPTISLLPGVYDKADYSSVFATDFMTGLSSRHRKDSKVHIRFVHD